MTNGTQKRPLQISPDYRLILAGFENEIIRGNTNRKVPDYLKRGDIWKTLEPDLQLKWARLAQMGGDMETALEVLAFINGNNPAFPEAWSQRLELLVMLERREELAKIFPIAKKAVGQDHHKELLRFMKYSGLREAESDVLAAASPLDSYRSRKEAVDMYLGIFSGREDCFARQWANKEESKHGYVPVRRPMEAADIEEHLIGRKTYGIYLLDSMSRVRTAVIDADLVKELREGKLKAEEKNLIKKEGIYLIERLKEISEESGLYPFIEFSGGKGFHLWYFFQTPVDAKAARAALDAVVKVFSRDLSAFHLEVFPKQDKLKGKGLGNLVKLPLGIHRLKGKRSYFLNCHDRSLDGQLNCLKKVRFSELENMKIPPGDINDEKVLVHPRWKEWTNEFPALAALEESCPPIGQIIAFCRQGRDISVREEKVLFQTIGFLSEAKKLLHHLFSGQTDYNIHLVDYKLSRIRGKPLGCKRIHSLLGFTGEACPFNPGVEYAHPLLHTAQWKEEETMKSEKVENLSSALDNLRNAISQLERFMR